MDPTIELVIAKNSFTEERKEIDYPPSYQATERDQLNYQYVDGGTPEKYKELKDENGPYAPSKIGLSIFSDFEAIKLANIDAVFNFTQRQGGMFGPQELKTYQYIAINPGFGGYHQYLQYRILRSFGYSISPFDANKKLNEKYVDTRSERFKSIIGKNKTGHLIPNLQSIIDEISLTDPNNIDLIVSNMTDRRMQYIAYLASQAILALSCLKRNGFWIAHLTIIDQPIADLLYIISLIFDKIAIFKPMASYYTNDLYLIAEGPWNNSSYIDVLRDLADLRKHPRYPKSLLTNRSLGFDQYLNQVLSLKFDETKIYRYEKSLIVWDLPGNTNKRPLIYSYGEKRKEAEAPKHITLNSLYENNVELLKQNKYQELYEKNQKFGTQSVKMVELLNAINITDLGMPHSQIIEEPIIASLSPPSIIQ